MHNPKTLPQQGVSGALAASPFARKAALAASLMIAGASGLSLPSCSGKVAGDERSHWLPASVFELGGGGETVAVRSVYAGMDSADVFGVTTYYGRISDIPQPVTDRERRLTRLIFSQLQSSFDFTDPRAASMLGNDVLVYMTDPSAWPNAIFVKDMAAAYNYAVLDLRGSTLSDCSAGPCIIRDVIAINNKSGFSPSADSLDSLTDAERTTLSAIAKTVGEEVLHDFWLDGLDAYARAGFLSGFNGLWSAGSLGEEDDGVLSSAWKTGNVPSAIAPDGTVNSYSLRSAVLGAIATYCPGCTMQGQMEIEVAVISYLQLIGDQADSFMGSSPHCYLEFYRKQDEAKGKAPGSYLSYRSFFIERESFPHIGNGEAFQLVLPAYLRAPFEPFCRKNHLDLIFNDGAPGGNPAVNANPYLSDPAAFLSLVQAIIPPVIAAAKGP
jgi:hypothetical protein